MTTAREITPRTIGIRIGSARFIVTCCPAEQAGRLVAASSAAP